MLTMFYLCTIFNVKGRVCCALFRKHSITAVVQCLGIISEQRKLVSL